MGAFEHYEVVRVRETPATIAADVSGLEGAVLGVSAEDDGRVVGYAVALYGRERTTMFQPDELETTGRFDRAESFYDGTSIRVSTRGEFRGPGKHRPA
ncbi:MAG: immunity protein 31 [Thermoleophilia bacterium]|nr:immunity protein 31 [Thermoleophilia bacterium]